MAKPDPHLTIEELSALLDAQLAHEEMDNEASRHLASCQQCQRELAELRQTVTLLRALPQPALPRSFALPPGTTQLDPPVIQSLTEPNIHILRSTNEAHRPAQPALRRRSTGRRIMSVVGTLAAVVGILFVLSGFVTSLPYSGATSASTAASSSTSAGAARNGSAASSASGPVESTTPAGVAQNSTPPAQQAQGIQAAQDPDYRQAQGADNGQAATAKDQKESAPQGAPSPSVLSFLDIGAPGVRIGLGILLFIAGAMGIAVGRDRGKRVNT